MGGKVFSGPETGLLTPRMDRTVYNHVKNQCTAALKNIGFSRVKIPIEAPAKDTFGDVDILVSREGTDFPATASLGNDDTWDKIQRALGAVHSYSEGRRGPDRQLIIESKNFAIPWPVGVGAPGGPPKAASGPARFVQIDVGLCDSHQELEWRVFKHDHGDLWNILGQMIRPFGLTADEAGLNIRIPELEKQDKKKARVRLTSDPAAAIAFLGLNKRNGDEDKPFKIERDLFEYASSCKWFKQWLMIQQQAGDGDEKGAKDDLERAGKRPVFARWANDFVPAKRRSMASSPQKSMPVLDRDKVRAEAFGAFPSTEDKWNARLAEWNAEQSRNAVKREIKKDAWLPADISRALPAAAHPSEEGKVVPRDVRMANWRGALRSALVKAVIENNGSFGVTPSGLRDAQGVLQADLVREWIRKNWEEVGRHAWNINCDRARKSVERKRKAAENAQKAKA